MTTPILGIDVSKDKLDCCFLAPGGKHSLIVNNSLAGYKELRKKIRALKLTSLHAGLEATGRYSHGIANFLHQQGFTVSVINPRRIKSFGASKLLRNKHDKADASLIAQFVKESSPEPWVPPSKEQVQLQELTRLLQCRKEERASEYNRLESKPECLVVLKNIKAAIASLDRSIDHLEKAVADLAKRSAELKESTELLCSAPGFGPTTAAIIMAELPPVTQFKSCSQAAAFAGVTPRTYSSGTSVKGKTHMCKTGNRHLRRALYLPALTAIRCNPLIMNMAARLAERGKSKMAIIGAVMHKLLRIAFGILKHRKPFDANWTQNLQPTLIIEPKKKENQKRFSLLSGSFLVQLQN